MAVKVDTFYKSQFDRYLSTAKTLDDSKAIANEIAKISGDVFGNLMLTALAFGKNCKGATIPSFDVVWDAFCTPYYAGRKALAADTVSNYKKALSYCVEAGARGKDKWDATDYVVMAASLSDIALGTRGTFVKNLCALDKPPTAAWLKENTPVRKTGEKHEPTIYARLPTVEKACASFGELENMPAEVAAAFKAVYDAVVVLKGAVTKAKNAEAPKTGETKKKGPTTAQRFAAIAARFKAQPNGADKSE